MCLPTLLKHTKKCKFSTFSAFFTTTNNCQETFLQDSEAFTSELIIENLEELLIKHA